MLCSSWFSFTFQILDHVICALGAHLTQSKPLPPVVIDQPDLFTHLFQGFFDLIFFCTMAAKILFIPQRGGQGVVWESLLPGMHFHSFKNNGVGLFPTQNINCLGLFSKFSRRWKLDKIIFWPRNIILIDFVTQNLRILQLCFKGQEDVGVDRLQAVLLELLLCLNRHQVKDYCSGCNIQGHLLLYTNK